MKQESMGTSRAILKKLRKSEDKKDLALRFKLFLDELAELSTDYGIAIHSTGGVRYFFDGEMIIYDDDYSSGDLEYEAYPTDPPPKMIEEEPKRHLFRWGGTRE